MTYMFVIKQYKTYNFDLFSQNCEFVSHTCEFIYLFFPAMDFNLSLDITSEFILYIAILCLFVFL